MSFYSKNRRLLQAKYPHLGSKLDQINVKNIEVLATKNGLPTIQIQFQSRTQLIHSQYDPLKEAATLLSRHSQLKDANFFLVLGIGLGYPFFELVKKVGWNKRIIVIEPQLAFFKLTMEFFDLENFINSPNIVFFINESIDYITAELTKQIDFSHLKEALIIEHPVSGQIMPEYFSALKEAIRGTFVRTGGNLLTLMLSATDYQMNTLANLDEIIKNPPVKNLFGKFKAQPAIVISAGPSLDKNVHLLREVSDHAVLISVETAFKPLSSKNIKPHLVIAADPLEDNYQHLAGAYSQETYLVAEPMTYPAILHNYCGRKFITTFKDVMMEWIAQFVGDLGFLRAWGSISTMGFDLARAMGCDPIILIGQDLSFPGNRKYCHNTHWEESWLYNYEGFQPLNVIHENFITVDKTREAIAIDGQKVVTNQQLYAYRKWFEEEIKRTEARCFNATEGGVLEAKGLQLISLKEAIYRFCRKKLPIRQTLEVCYQERPAIKLEGLQLALGQVLEEMKRVQEKCIAGINLTEKLEELKSNMAEAQQVYEQMNKIVSYINEQENLSPFLIMANQKGRYRFRRSQFEMEGQTATREILEKTSQVYLDFFKSVCQSIDFMQPNFEAALTRVERK